MMVVYIVMQSDLVDFLLLCIFLAMLQDDASKEQVRKESVYKRRGLRVI